MAESNAYDETIRQIQEADLTPKSQLAAMGLLGAAHKGTLICNRERAGQLCGTTSWGATRRMLIKLKAAGLIHYRTNEMAYVAFPCFFNDADGATDDQQSDLWRAESDLSRAKSDHEPEYEPEDATKKRAPEITFRSTTREKRAMAREKRSLGDGVLVGMGGMVINPDPNLIDPHTNHPQRPTTDTAAPTEPDRRWIFDLLTDPAIDMIPAKALAAARLNTPERVTRCVAAWWVMPDRRTAGLLVHWLVTTATDAKRRYRPGPPGAEFLDSEFYRRHHEQAWELADVGDLASLPRWLTELPEPPRVIEFVDASGIVHRVPDDSWEQRHRYGQYGEVGP